jgi:hypothetical protein
MLHERRGNRIKIFFCGYRFGKVGCVGIGSANRQPELNSISVGISQRVPNLADLLDHRYLLSANFANHFHAL